MLGYLGKCFVRGCRYVWSDLSFGGWKIRTWALYGVMWASSASSLMSLAAVVAMDVMQ